MCRISNSNDRSPFAVACYCGPSKPPSARTFLKRFIEEFNFILEHEVYLNGKHYKLDLKGIICDALARSLVKAIKGHKAYGGWERCNTKRMYHMR